MEQFRIIQSAAVLHALASFHVWFFSMTNSKFYTAQQPAPNRSHHGHSLILPF